MKKNPVFPKFRKKCLKSDVFGFFSKSALRIFLIFCVWLEGIIALILPKTACSAKFRFRSYGPKRPENRSFSTAHISRTKRANEYLIRFSDSSVLSLQKMSYQIFRTLTLHPQNWDRTWEPKKVPILVFRYSQVWVVRFSSYCTVRWKTMRAHFCKDFILIAFSVLDLWPFYENDPKSAQKHDFWFFS